MRIRVYVGVALGALLLVPMGVHGMINVGNNEGLTGSVGGGIDSYNIKKQQLEALMQQLNTLQIQQRALTQSQFGQSLTATSGTSFDFTAGVLSKSTATVNSIKTSQNFQAALQKLNQLRTQLQSLQSSGNGALPASSGNSGSSSFPASINSNVSTMIKAGDNAPAIQPCNIVPVLNSGGSGDDVSMVQRALTSEGSYKEGLVTGFYGKLTTAAVKVFQNKNNLPATGTIDAQTAQALNVIVPLSQRCLPIKISKGYTGTLQPASSTSIWGTHQLFVDGFVLNGNGATASFGRNAQITYLVKAADDTVLAKLKGLEGKHVSIIGTLASMNIGSTNFWALTARDVSLASSTPNTWPGNGGGGTGGGVSGGGSGSGSGTGGTSSGGGTSGGSSSSAGTTLVIGGSTYLPTALVGTAYSATIGVTGGSGQYRWTFISGDSSNQFGNSFPAGSGLSMGGGSGSSVTIGGTPTTSDSGKEYFFALRVDSGSEYVIKNFILYVSPGTSNGTGTAVSVVLVTPPNWQEPGTVGQPYSTTFVAANEPEGSYQWGIVDGSLPPGLSLSGGNNSQTTVAGTPTISGSYGFKLRVSSTYGGSAQNQYNITIYAGTATSSTSTSGGGAGTQGGTSDASSQESTLMASVLESMRGVLQQMLGSFSL
ncbi:MAG: peptidoglycan-binding domain-containing protein [Candidatus Paceibacterota bacterium]|jgi:peptidoglycan hydrolase-like protein with peptidoglycan-binding domain